MKTILSIWWTTILSIVVAGLLYVAMFGGLSSLDKPRGNVFSGIQSCPDEPLKTSTLFYKLLPAPRTVKLCGRFSGTEDTLVLSRVTAYGIRVFVDGKLRYSPGTPDQTGNFWYSPHVVFMGKGSRGKTRHVRIELHGLYDVGLQRLPYVVRWEQHRGFLWFNLFMHREMQWILVAATFTMGLLLLMFSLYPMIYRRVYLMAGLAALCSGVYLQDFVFFQSLGTNAHFMFSRQLSFSCAILSTLLMLGAMERLILRKSRLVYGLALPCFLAIVGLWSQSDLAGVKSMMAMTGLIGVVNPILAFAIVLRSRNSLLVVTWGFYFFSVVHSVVILATKMDAVYLSNYGIAASLLALGIFLLQQYHRVHVELTESRQKANHDSLTGAYNRHFMNELETDSEDYLVLVDMNNFKFINDTYGHHIGDDMLVRWVACAREEIRFHDRVIRLGGDEFLVLLHRPEPSSVVRIMQRIEIKWRALFPDYPVSLSYGAERVRDSFETAMQRADHKMFKHKKERKKLQYEFLPAEVEEFVSGEFNTMLTNEYSTVWTSESGEFSRFGDV